MRSALAAQITPERVKDLLVATVFTTCGPRPGSKSPTMFIKTWSLIEYDEAWVKLLPQPISTAERMDNVQYKADVIVSGSAWRQFEGPNWSPRENSDIRPSVTIAQLEAKRPGYSFKDIMIEKKNGKWSFVLTGVAQPGDIDPDEFSKKKVACSAAMSDNPEK